MDTANHTRVVIGGGLFGVYSSLVLAKKGFSVLLLEQDSKIMARGSYVNQARLHTGLHYPRSLITASVSLNHYKSFRKRYPTSVKDFKQIYAISKYNSKTSGEDFKNFILRLGIDFKEIDATKYFCNEMVSHAFEVEEPTFDSEILRLQLMEEINNSSLIKLSLNTSVMKGSVREGVWTLQLSDETRIETEGIVIAAYAGTNSVRHSLGLSLLPLNFEIAEVNLGTVTPEMEGIGFTVMDGPFWSLMPFGNTGQVSLTSVGLTPLRRSTNLPIFDCQAKREGCSGAQLANCGTCEVRPASTVGHQIQQMSLFLKNKSFFTPTKSLLTVKSILSTTEVDDARPTLIHKEESQNIWTVFSGKVSSMFDLEEALF